MDNINPFQYGGTGGSVQRQTSIDREEYERNSGETKARAIRFMTIFHDYGEMGVTWKEMKDHYKTRYTVELHHGQISGLLTNLHKDGKIFIAASNRRDGCFAYMHSAQKPYFKDRFDSPVQTKAGMRKAALEKFVKQVEIITREMEWGDAQDTILIMLNHALLNLQDEIQ